MKKNGSLVFIGLAMGITWLLWIPALVLVSSKGYPLPTIDYLLKQRSFAIVNSEHGLVVVLISLAVYGPLAAQPPKGPYVGYDAGPYPCLAVVLRMNIYTFQIMGMMYNRTVSGQGKSRGTTLATPQIYS